MDGSVRRLADAQPGFGRCGPDRGDAHRGREHHGCAPQRRGEDTDLAHRPGDRCPGRPECEELALRRRRQGGRLCLLRRAVRLDFEVQRCRLRGRTYAEGSGQYLHGGEQGSIRSRQSVFRCRTDRFQSRFTDDLRLLGLSQNGCRRQADRNHPAGSCDSRGAGH